MSRYDHYLAELEGLRRDNSLRFLKKIERRQEKYLVYQGRKYLNLSSNDYLGLATDVKLHQEFYLGLEKGIIDRYGLGSSSSRLLTGDSILYRDLEDALSELYNGPHNGDQNAGRKEALVFTSGYHANTGVIPAIAGKGDIILSDELNHASIIDGARLSGADRHVFGHCDYDGLAAVLQQRRDGYRQALIVSESLFSMGGDMADLKRLIALKEKFNALLYIDEAHAFGVYGERGCGICEELGVLGEIDIIIGTFGKAAASMGAFAISDPVIKDLLINTMRPLIFSTALPPVLVNWNLFIVKKFLSFHKRREHLFKTAGILRDDLESRGLITCGNSQIVPVIIGDNEKAITIAERLMENGFLCFPIRPPSVPRGTSRIRLSLSSLMEWKDLRGISRIISA